MSRRFAIVFMALCGLADTPLQAAPALDKVVSVAGETLQLTKTGPVQLAYVYLPDPAVLAALEGASVRVQPQGVDRYGRTLALLTRAGEKEPVQMGLLRDGKAFAYSAGAFRQSKTWAKAEGEAQAARRGVWAEKPLTPQSVVGHRQEFVQVAGTIARVFQSRNSYYINFGEDWKTDFSLRIPRAAWRGFGKNFAFTPGTVIRARGMLTEENGPMLVITRPEQIETL